MTRKRVAVSAAMLSSKEHAGLPTEMEGEAPASQPEFLKTSPWRSRGSAAQWRSRSR
mgnify:CR=1 FL=1